MPRNLRILCIAPMYPWPEVDGYRQRLGNLVLGLAEAGTVDLVTFDLSADSTAEPVPDERIRWLPTTGDRSRTRREWMPTWLTSDLPRLALAGWYRTAAGRPPVWRDDYDVAFLYDLPTWVQMRGVLPPIPIAVDIADLPSVLVGRRWRRGPSRATHAGWAQRARRLVSWAGSAPFDVVDARRWRRWERRAVEEVAAITVCSEVDVGILQRIADRSTAGRASTGRQAAVRAVPNGYELRWPAGDHSAVPATPVVLFVGLLAYGPNQDAARWFATEVFPALRRQMPLATFRVVGREPTSLADLIGLPGVELVGEVGTMREELDRADLSVVPIRHGGGTRLKVTEALANRIPCVTTTVGCEGIEVVDGEHVLIADDAEGFVTACMRALGDPDLRRRLSENGAALYEASYRWSGIRTGFADVARSISSVRPVPDHRG